MGMIRILIPISSALLVFSAMPANSQAIPQGPMDKATSQQIEKAVQSALEPVGLSGYQIQELKLKKKPTTSAHLECTVDESGNVDCHIE
jgi:hypothetical protein